MNYLATAGEATAIIDEVVAEQEPAFAGVDVSKDFFDAALWDADQPIEVSAMKRMTVKRFDRTCEGVEEIFAWADADTGVDLKSIRVPSEGLLWLGTKITDLFFEEIPALFLTLVFFERQRIDGSQQTEFTLQLPHPTGRSGTVG